MSADERVKLHELAERELTDGVRFYLSVSSELATSFLDDVETSLSRISRHPQMGAQVTVQVRSLPLARFPYSVFYRAKDAAIEVLALGHHRRRPLYWRRRT
ncbi:MAG TPA: type II toxin-antitoxin system RelE/ParE family toxin [Myxococcota bacterium]|nr:type II toxin-antitoxin system RelE/ParE family toxin [Myxococcota bacterium]